MNLLVFIERDFWKDIVVCFEYLSVKRAPNIRKPVNWFVIQIVKVIAKRHFCTDYVWRQLLVWIFLSVTMYYTVHSWHGCISDASLRRLIQCLRNISKRADFQISETSPGRFIKDVSSETSLRSLRFSQRRLWIVSETVILGLQTKTFLANSSST